MRAPDHQDDDLFWAFRLLDTVVDRQHLDSASLAEALRDHDLWPGAAPKRRHRLRPEAVAVLAATVAWPASALAEEHHAGGGAHQDSAHAETGAHDASVTLSVSDASSSQPLAGIRVLGAGGKVLGTTGQDGRLSLPVGQLGGGEIQLEGTGYRSLTRKRLNRTRPGTTVFIGLVPDAAAAPAQAAQHEARHDAHAAKSGEHHDAHAAPKDAHAGDDHHGATAIKVHFPSPTPAPRKVAKRPRPAEHEVVEQKAVAHGAQAPHGEAPAHHDAPAAHKAAPAHHDAPEHHEAPAAHDAAPTAHHDAPAAHAAADHHAGGKGVITVKTGDTLWGLAATHLGSGERWRTLWAANRAAVPSPARLRVGQVLTLETSGDAGHVTHHAAGHGTIRVRRGDSLWVLARKHLGSGKRWRTLYRMNRDLIARPELIYPGQKLRLPGEA
ncbi:MAG: LysM peptidoglycan-binding domain-containing protein [Candidatus Sericytochromatia bacterium]|nr:LysM peptidoglycan-binding domain-containing protein [Candidatus Sericytochromatia bacterium]